MTMQMRLLASREFSQFNRKQPKQLSMCIRNGKVHDCIENERQVVLPPENRAQQKQEETKSQRVKGGGPWKHASMQD